MLGKISLFLAVAALFFSALEWQARRGDEHLRIELAATRARVDSQAARLDLLESRVDKITGVLTESPRREEAPALVASSAVIAPSAPSVQPTVTTRQAEAAATIDDLVDQAIRRRLWTAKDSAALHEAAPNATPDAVKAALARRSSAINRGDLKMEH